jgi:hypothetical protein
VEAHQVPWLGLKRIAFIPVDRGIRYNESPQGVPGFAVPADWRAQIERRIYYDRDLVTGINVSLRDYIHTISQGRADLDGVVRDVVFVDQKDVPPNHLGAQVKQQLQGEGFDAAALVLLGGTNAGQGEKDGGFWARFTMAEGVGVWAMELIHVLANFMDLYTNDKANDLNSFDNMDLGMGTHPTAYTKVQLGWLDASAIVVQSDPRAEYDLHSIGLVQPAPTGRTTAVQVNAGGRQFFIESRQRVDRYEGPSQWDQLNRRWEKAARGGTMTDNVQTRAGIASEGVIVYEYAGRQNPAARPDQICPLLRLHTTPEALRPGQSITRGGVTVQVLAEITGGYTVVVNDLTVPGSLLRYVDLTSQGINGHSDPVMIGGGGWQAFTFLVGGSGGVIYAVNSAGELLRYVDLTSQGINGHSDPVVIGGGGWQAFKFLTAGDNGVLYAVNAAGELVRYEDLTSQGINGHSDPVVIGGGGWQAFTSLFGGSNGVIYAVNAAGELVRYEDLTSQGINGHSDPVVIGGGGWQAFTFLVGGDNGVIYAVNAAGELLRYEDLTAQGISGHSDPVVIGGSSWDDFAFLACGDDGVIYAVVA